MLWVSVGLEVFKQVISTACLLPVSTRLLVADISLNIYSATSSGNLKLPTNILNLQVAEVKPESQKHWPNYAEAVLE